MARFRTADRRRNREGATAVEFALVALPFAFVMFAILEIGVVFVLDSILENSVVEAGRLVRTGQAERAGFSQARFKTELCSRMSIFQNDCSARATVDVRVIPRFDDPDVPDPTAGGSFNGSGTTYQGGDPGNIVLVRVWYRQPLITPFLSQGLSRLNDGATLLTASTAFRNEPWVTPTGGGGTGA
jgi:Flp pilus assembly protein TadG